MTELPADFFEPGPRWQRNRPNTWLLAAGLIVSAILMVVFPYYALTEVTARTGFVVTLADVPHGVSVHAIGETRVFLVREARDVTGLRSTSPHLGVAMWWCPQERVFLSPAHGEVYDTRGRLIWGQSPADMRRFEVDVLSDRVLLRPERLHAVVQARPRAESDLAPEIREVIATGSCADHVA